MILATICYIRKGGQTLMLHRTKKEKDFNKDKYVAPGGRFEKDESPEECVMREISEECDLTLIEPRFAGIVTLTDEIHNESFNDGWYLFIFEADRFKGDVKECNEGDLEWIANEKLDSLPVWEGDHDIMRWVQDGRFFSAKQRYRGHELLESTVIFYYDKTEGI